MSRWQTLFDLYVIAVPEIRESIFRSPKCFFSKEDLKEFREIKASDEGVSFLIETLEDERNRVFVKTLVEAANYVPKCLIEPMIKAAVYCHNPSFNKHYLTHVIKQNAKVTYKVLVSFMNSNEPVEVAGSARALYWFFALNQTYDVSEIDRLELRNLKLKHFVNSNDIHVLRSMIPDLSFNKADYSSEHSELVDLAYQKASKHQDEYIQNRFEITTGRTNLFNALPHTH